MVQFKINGSVVAPPKQSHMKEHLCVLVLRRWDLNHNTTWQDFQQHVTGLSYPTMLADLKGIYISVTFISHYSV